MSDEFVVNDRRLFSKDGQVNPESAAEEPSSGPVAAESGEKAPSAAPTGGGIQMPLPPANLAGLLVGLATSAFMHLGEAPEGLEQGKVDLPAAQHAIDLLAVLQAKTKGNLEAEEEALLNTLLYDLRLKYIQASR